MENDSLNTILWVNLDALCPLKFQFCLNEIKTLSSSVQVEFHLCLIISKWHGRFSSEEGSGQGSSLLATKLICCNLVLLH